MASLFLARASFALGAWLVTPVEMSTLSGAVLIEPVAGSEIVRLWSVSSARARLGTRVAASIRTKAARERSETVIGFLPEVAQPRGRMNGEAGKGNELRAGSLAN
jgi:hypothetical protein